MSENKKSKKKSRRSFIHQASGAMGVVAVAAAGWPLVDQMNPSKDVEALATIEVDVSGFLLFALYFQLIIQAVQVVSVSLFQY